MPEIKILKPVRLTLSVEEVEEYLPSFRSIINIEFETGSNRVIFSGKSFWFECSKWDQFLNELNAIIDKGETSLEDMSNQIKISLFKKNDNEYGIKICFSKSLVEGGNFNIEYEVSLDNENWYHIINNFKDFPIWWK